MFDEFHQHHHSSHTSVSKTVHEHRAPTDKSVALLREMEAAAKDSVVKAVRVDDMGISCVVHESEDHLSGIWRFAVVYVLNGKRHTVRWDFNRAFVRSEDDEQRQIFSGLRDALAADIATNLLAEPLSKALRGKVGP